MKRSLPIGGYDFIYIVVLSTYSLISFNKPSNISSFLSNRWSLMFGLIWATFLPGNVVFIMALHPVSIISIILYTWLCFYGKKVPFVIILTDSSQKPSKLTQTYYIFIFSPGLCMECVPVHCQSASYNSQTSEEYQLHSKPLFHGGIRSYLTFQASFVACNCIPIWGYFQENDGQSHK